MAALIIHVLVKLPVMRRAWRERGGLAPLRQDLAHTVPEPPGEGGLAPVAPAEPTITRRGVLALMGAGSLTLLLANVGETIGGPLRKIALLAPRREDFPINKTARSARVAPAATGPSWRLELVAAGNVRRFSRDDLLAMDLHAETLPIACVEGWTTTQRWRASRFRCWRAGRRARRPHGARRVAAAARRVPAGDAQPRPDRDERSLLALQVNGDDLPLDHGYPARIIVPALPGVHYTKWCQG